MRTRSVAGVSVTIALALLAAAIAAAWPACTTTEEPPAPTPPPAPTAAPTPTATATPPPTATPVPTPTPAPTATPTPTALQGLIGGLFLERDVPELAKAINSLSWAQDGLDDAERTVIGEILNAAIAERFSDDTGNVPLTADIVALGWVMDGVDAGERMDLRKLLSLAVDAPAAAAAVLSLGWLQDGVARPESTALASITRIAKADAAAAAAAAALPWVQDDVTEAEALDLAALSFIANDKPTVAASLLALPWVFDGFYESERAAIALVEGADDADSAAAIVALPWVQDGLQDGELTVLQDLVETANTDSVTALTLLAFPWVTDGVDALEHEAILWLRGIDDAEVEASFLRLGWVEGADIMRVRTRYYSGPSGIPHIGGGYWDMPRNAGNNPAVTAFLLSLPWVADGIQERELVGIAWLRAIPNTEIVAAVLDLPWMQDGVQEEEQPALQELSQVAGNAPAMTASFLPILKRSAGDADSLIGVIQAVGFRPNQSAILFSLPWVRNGLREPEHEPFRDLTSLLWIDEGELVKFLTTLDWMQDGITNMEARVIDRLPFLNQHSDVTWAITRSAWVQDGVTELELEAITLVTGIGLDPRETGEHTLDILALGWVADGIEEPELQGIDELLYWARTPAYHEITVSLLTLGWVRDGLAAMEIEALAILRRIGYLGINDLGYYPELAASVLALGWMQDGVTEVELRALDQLTWSADNRPEAVTYMIGLEWMQDGVTDAEAEALDSLRSLAFLGMDVLQRVAAMPFMHAITSIDVLALISLVTLFQLDDPQVRETIFSSPMFQRGISDDTAPVLTVLGAIAEHKPALLPVYLDPARTSVEHRTTTTPLTGTVDLAIIRTRPGAANRMDYLEHAVRTAEDLVGAPFPTQAVVLWYEDLGLGYGGANFGTFINILPAGDLSYEIGGSIMHEVAHYYWRGNWGWVDEGAANLTAAVALERLNVRPLAVWERPCAYARTISEFERLNPAWLGPAFICNYSLGERLFMDLYKNLGIERFREGFLALYLTSQDPPTVLGIEHIREAFDAEDDETARAVIDHWYGIPDAAE